MTTLKNEFMNAFNIDVISCPSVYYDNDSTMIEFTIKSHLGADTFNEFLKKNEFTGKWELEKTDTYIHSNEIKRMEKLFELTDQTIAQYRQHHLPIKEIQVFLQNWLDNNQDCFK